MRSWTPRDERVRLADDDRGGEDLLAADPGELPEPGEGEGLEVLAAEAVGLLAVGALLPLEEAGRRDQARRLAKASRKSGMLVRRSRPAR